MTRRVDLYHGLAQASRLRILDALIDHPGLGLADLSTRTGLHENTLRDHVRVLESEGFITSRLEHLGTRGRPRRIFDAVRGDTPNEIAERRVQAAKSRGDLFRRVMPDAGGTVDDETAHQLDALYEHLDEVGLEPDIDQDSLVVSLVPCPFHDVIENNREIACHVHAELIQNVLSRAGGPVTLERLLPFTTPHSCHARLRRESPPSDGTISTV